MAMSALDISGLTRNGSRKQNGNTIRDRKRITQKPQENKANLMSVGFLVMAVFVISLQNIAIKWIGGDYTVLEIVTIRSLVALPFTLLFYRLEGKLGFSKTQQRKLR
jgi:hypothetical protein